MEWKLVAPDSFKWIENMTQKYLNTLQLRHE